MSTPKKPLRGIQLKSDIEQTITHLPVSKILAHSVVQVRAGGLDQDYVDELLVQMLDGVQLPPIVVFHVDGLRDWTNEEKWIKAFNGAIFVADGFHRLAAAQKGQSAGIKEIGVDVRKGTIRDAIRYALGANGQHGKRRNRMDLERAYQIGVTEEFFAEDDAAAVAKILNCSERWARQLTKEAREAARASRDAQIEFLEDSGKTQREIAKEVGVQQSTVSEVLDRKRKSSVSDQEEIPPEQSIRKRKRNPGFLRASDVREALDLLEKKESASTVEQVQPPPEKPPQPSQPEPEVRSCDPTDVALEHARVVVRALTVGDLERFKTWFGEYCQAIEETPSLMERAKHRGGLCVVGGVN